MFNFLKRKNIEAKQFCSVVNGKSIDLSEVKDEMFSQKLLGDGIAVIPNCDNFVSPCNGKITMIAESKHAIAIENFDGLQVLIHIGLDTVKLNGEGFDILCKEGDFVKIGTLLAKVDRQFLREKNIEDITMMIIIEENGHKIESQNIGSNAIAGETVLIKYE